MIAARHRRHGRLGLVIGLWLAGAATAAGAVELAVEPAWGGHFRPGTTSGLEVRIVTGDGGPARLRIDDGTLPQTLAVETRAEEPLTARFVVTPPADGSVVVTYSGSGGRKVEEARYLPLSLGQSLTAELGASRTLDQPGRVRVVVDPAAVPGEAAAWRTLQTLAIDRRALSELPGHARRALGDWLAACGAVVAGDPGLRAVLAESAGCGGRRVVSAAQDDVPAAALPALDARRLDALLDLPASPLSRPLLLLLGGYLAGLWLLRRARPAWLIGVPVAAVALTVATFGAGRSTTAVAAWDEQTSGADHARRSELWRISGGGPGHVELPVTAGYPRRLDAEGNAELLIGDGPARLAVITGLLSTSRFALQGVSSAAAAPELAWRDGEPLVTAPAGNRIDAAWLRWRGRTLRVPPLAAGTSWQAGDDSEEVAADSAALRLLVERAGYAALLVEEADAHWRVIYPGGPS